MTKKIKVITVQQNQLLEIPNDNIEIEIQENNEEIPVIVDNTENQTLPLNDGEVEEPQDVKHDLTEIIVKVKKPRVKKDQLPLAIIEENKDIIEPVNKIKKTRVKKEIVDNKSNDIETTRQIEVSDVLNVQPELTKKEVKLLQLVKCEKCNRKMTEQTLKYKHQKSCSGNNPKQPKIKEVKTDQIQDIEDIKLDPPPMMPLKRSTNQCSLTVRQNKINQKKEHFKTLFANAI